MFNRLACLSGNIHFISTQPRGGREKKRKKKKLSLFEDKLGISCSEMIYVPIWGEAACLNPLLLPPRCLFSASTCVTFSVAHILVIREDWLTASYEDGCGY